MLRKSKKHKLQISLSAQNKKPSCFVLNLKEQVNQKQKTNKQITLCKYLRNIAQIFKKYFFQLANISHRRIAMLNAGNIIRAFKKYYKKHYTDIKKYIFQNQCCRESHSRHSRQHAIRKAFQRVKSRIKKNCYITKKQCFVSKINSINFKTCSTFNIPRPIFDALCFALILFILIIPFKAFTYYQSLDINKLSAKISNISKVGFKNLLFAAQSAGEMDFDQAGNDFAEISSNFLKARQELESVDDIIFTLTKIIPNKKARLAGVGKDILQVGESAASLGHNLSLAFSNLLKIKPGLLEQKNNLDKLDNFINYASQAIKNAEDLNLQLANIDSAIVPDEYKNQFILLKQQTNNITKLTKELVKIANKLKIFLGIDEDKRYLLIFQNNTELRATGGFIGSFATIDFHGGKIKDIKVPEDGGYDVKNELSELITAPEPLQLISPLWHFWDANWWPDWSTSAVKLKEFYEKSNNSKIDGVISFTPTVFEKLLSIIGPVDMTENYGVIIDDNNFWVTVQGIVERQNLPLESGHEFESIDGKPKKIIGDLMNKIINEFPEHLNKNTLIKLLELTEQSLLEKHILLYFTDANLQTEVEQRGWDGKIKNTNLDYLSVINTNIGGEKTDKVVKEMIEHNSEIMPDGSVINSVTIKRFHTGIKGQYFYGVRNIDWMRIYVPEGSELLEARGFEKPDDKYFEKPDVNWTKDPLLAEEVNAEIHQPSKTKIYQENNKTVFANWSMVDPGESVTIYLKYKLPFNLFSQRQNPLAGDSDGAKVGDSDGDRKKYKLPFNLFKTNQKSFYSYSFLAQKQSGSLGSKFESNLKLPPGFKIIQKYPGNLPSTEDGWMINNKLNTDKYWAVVFINM